MADIADGASDKIEREDDRPVLWIDDPITGQATVFGPLDISQDVLLGEPDPFTAL